MDFQSKNIKVFLLIALGCIGGLTATTDVNAQLNLNLIAVNASEKEAREIDVKYELPKELKPEDILETGPLKVDYDVDRELYFVYGTVQFQPKESKTFKIKVNDVWRIGDEEIEVIRQYMDKTLESLKGKDEYALATQKRDELIGELDYIIAQQKNYSENIDRRIEQYRAYATRLDKIRRTAFDIASLKEQAIGLEEERNQTVKFQIEVTNPHSYEKTFIHKHYLPKEVRTEQVVEAQGFDIRYDDRKDAAFLTKEEPFAPNETKKYQITIKDIWNIPISTVDTLLKQANEAIEELRDSEYEEGAQYLFNGIQTRLSAIRDTQGKQQPIKQHIGQFRINEQRFNEAKKDVELIEQMLSIIRAKRLEELESRKVKNVLEKLKALRGLRALSEALFKKGISVTLTWRIIAGAIGFVAFFTTVHFFIWAKRSGRSGEERGLPAGEEIKVVPKPGEGKKEEDD